MKVNDVIDSLLAKSLTPEYVAYLTGLPLADILKRPGADGAVSGDTISSAMENLIWKAYEEADLMLTHGTDAAKTRIIMGLLGPAAREVGKQAEAQLAEQLEEFRKLMGAQSHGDADEGDDPDQFDPSVSPQAPLDTYDS